MADQKQAKPLTADELDALRKANGDDAYTAALDAQGGLTAEEIASSTGSPAPAGAIKERARRLAATGEAPTATESAQGKYLVISPTEFSMPGDREDFKHLDKDQIKRLIDLNVIADPAKLKTVHIERLRAAGVRGEWDEA